MKALILIPVFALLVGCATHGGGDRVVAAASPDQQKALLGQVKMLEGKWMGKSEDGKEHLMTEYKVSSAGNVVREIMFPGSDHEMTNVYHMDGKDLVMTHYCAVGNQPRMRTDTTSGNTIHFVYDSATNHTSMDQVCMREMSLEIQDKDHIVQHWRAWQNGKAMPETAFAMTRMK
jgi:hypothetical protein